MDFVLQEAFSFFSSVDNFFVFTKGRKLLYQIFSEIGIIFSEKLMCP